MTSLPAWLVERAAVGEVPAAGRARLEAADPDELAERIAAVHAGNEAELAAYPAGPAIAQIEARVASERKRRVSRRRRMLGVAGVMTSAAAVAIVLLAMPRSVVEDEPSGSDDGIRVKGHARLVAFRQAGDRVENLDEDALVRAGDLIQLRYNGGGKSHGLIASVDGAGAVTLHFPASEDAPTKLATGTTALPHAYALDDAPRFERFFFVTADDSIDVKRTLATLGAFARRGDCATASPDLPTGLRQWSLRLRKPDRPTP